MSHHITSRLDLTGFVLSCMCVLVYINRYLKFIFLLYILQCNVKSVIYTPLHVPGTHEACEHSHFSYSPSINVILFCPISSHLLLQRVDRSEIIKNLDTGLSRAEPGNSLSNQNSFVYPSEKKGIRRNDGQPEKIQQMVLTAQWSCQVNLGVVVSHVRHVYTGKHLVTVILVAVTWTSAFYSNFFSMNVRVNVSSF